MFNLYIFSLTPEGGGLPGLRENSLSFFSFIEPFPKRLIFKNGKRIQTYGYLTRKHFLDAQQVSEDIVYPYDPEDPDKSEEGGLKYNPNMRVENEEDRLALTGKVIRIPPSKTGEPSILWISKYDLVLMQSLEAINEVFCKAHNYPYRIQDRFFINSHGNPLLGKENKSSLNFTEFCELTGIQDFHAHLSRNFMANFASIAKSELIKECTALHANHSKETQANTYVNRAYKELKAVKGSTAYQSYALPNEPNYQTDKSNYVLSEEYERNRKKNLKISKQMDEERYRAVLLNRFEKQAGSYDRFVTDHMKWACLSCIIELGQIPSLRRSHDLLEEFLAGKKSLRNRNSQTLFLQMLDIGGYLEIEGAQVLLATMNNLANLVALDPDYEGLEPLNMLSVVEHRFTMSLMELLDKMRKREKPLKNWLMVDLLIKCNQEHGWNYYFNNPIIKVSLQNIADDDSEDSDDDTRTEKESTAVKAPDDDSSDNSLGENWETAKEVRYISEEFSYDYLLIIPYIQETTTAHEKDHSESSLDDAWESSTGRTNRSRHIRNKFLEYTPVKNLKKEGSLDDTIPAPPKKYTWTDHGICNHT